MCSSGLSFPVVASPVGVEGGAAEFLLSGRCWLSREMVLERSDWRSGMLVIVLRDDLSMGFRGRASTEPDRISSFFRRTSVGRGASSVGISPASSSCTASVLSPFTSFVSSRKVTSSSEDESRRAFLAGPLVCCTDS